MDSLIFIDLLSPINLFSLERIPTVKPRERTSELSLDNSPAPGVQHVLRPRNPEKVSRNDRAHQNYRRDCEFFAPDEVKVVQRDSAGLSPLSSARGRL